MVRTKKRIPIAILSRGRSQTGTTWNIFPGSTVFVNENEKRDYRLVGRHNEIVTHDCNHSSTVRNFILDYYGSGQDIIMLDDDIRKVGRFVMRKGKPKAERMEGDEFLPHLLNGFKLARDRGAFLFGVAPNNNALNFRQQVTVGTFVNGPMMGMRITDLRFDLKCNNKSDYDYTLQYMQTGHLVFRLDYLWQVNDYNKMKGGTRFYRTKELERDTYHYLLAKWAGCLTPNPKRELEFVLRVTKRKRN